MPRPPASCRGTPLASGGLVELLRIQQVTQDGPRMRAALLEVVRGKPGINKNEACMRLGVTWNTVQHHVDVLARQGLIHVEDRGWSHELYAGDVPVAHRNWMRAWHDKESALVLGAVHAEPGIGVYRLSAALGTSRKTTRAHLSRLVADGLVCKLGAARPRYRPAAPPAGVAAPQPSNRLGPRPRP